MSRLEIEMADSSAVAKLDSLAPSNQTSSEKVNDFSSPCFTVLAGAEHERLLIHADVLSKAGKYRAIVNGVWQESETHEVDLEEWDAPTVIRLIDFLYRGDYLSPLPRSTNDEEDSQSTQSRPIYALKVKSDSSPRKMFEECFDQLKEQKGRKDYGNREHHAQGPKYPLITLRSNLIALYNSTTQVRQAAHQEEFLKWTFTGSFAGSYDFRETLFSHAKVYALADYVLLPHLKYLSLCRLSDALCFLGTRMMTKKISQDIVDLARYIYDTTAPSPGEPMRNMMSSFIVIMIGELDKSHVDALSTECSGCAVDLIGKAGQSLTYHREQDVRYKADVGDK